jgi:hypothetical protein
MTEPLQREATLAASIASLLWSNAGAVRGLVRLLRLPSLGQRGAQVQASNMSLRQPPSRRRVEDRTRERCEERLGRRRRDLVTQYFFDHIFP